MMKPSEGKLEHIASKEFETWSELYKVIDFLNKNLKEKNIMFGLTKDSEKETMTISIYQT